MDLKDFKAHIKGEAPKDTTKGVKVQEDGLKRPPTPKLIGLWLARYAQTQGIPFVVDDKNRALVNAICQYFAASKAFPGDLQKGLLISGPVGVGKTYLMAMASFMPLGRTNYAVMDVRKIVTEYSELGPSILNHYSNLEGICLDDLGQEHEGISYGQRADVLGQILSSRYNRFAFNKTHITTNLDFAQLSSKYGGRIADRFLQMFNILEVGGESRRQ
jgi:DNA replication protein DnaC